MINLARLHIPPDLRHLKAVIPPHQASLAALARYSGPVVAALAVRQEAALAPKWKALALRVAEAIRRHLPPVASAAVDRLGQGELAGVMTTIQRIRAEMMSTTPGTGAPQFDWPVSMGVLHSVTLSLQSWDVDNATLAARWLAEAIDAAMSLEPELVNAVCMQAFGEVEA